VVEVGEFFVVGVVGEFFVVVVVVVVVELLVFVPYYIFNYSYI
jgi:hypothetical protein